MPWMNVQKADEGKVDRSAEIESGLDTGDDSPPFQKEGIIPAPKRSLCARNTIFAQNWMSSIADAVPLAALTIPGTHDSAAYTNSWPFISTQGLDFEQQLNLGIRYFDIRCGIRNDKVELVHGLSYLGLKFDAVLKTLYTWLDEHPSEALIVQIKKDRRSERSSVSFESAILSIISHDPRRWRLESTTPTLGEVRGRIQLFRRFARDSPDECGIDVSRWSDNPDRPFLIYNPNGTKITIQDHYSFLTPEPLPSLVDKKLRNVTELLTRAMNNEDTWHWFVNFTSCYELNLYYQIPPHSIAVGAYWNFRRVSGINARLRASLAVMPMQRRRLGVVVMDFPEQGSENLVNVLILENIDVEPQRKSRLWLVCVLLLLLLLAWLARDKTFGCQDLLTGLEGQGQFQPGQAAFP